MSTLRPLPSRRNQAGFSLIELMIGLVIGMIAVFVMMQVFQVSEGVKRTTTGGGDAQTNGVIALDTLQREIQQSGYGITNTLALGCTITLPSGVPLPGLAPVTINHPSIPNDATNPNSDTLLVVSSSNNSLPGGDWVNGHAGLSITVATPALFSVGDQVIFVERLRDGGEVRPTAACNLAALRMQPVTAIAGSVLTVGTNVPGTGEGALLNLGPAATLRMQAYAVRNGNLTACNLATSDCTNAGLVNDETVWVPIDNGIVSLRAEYGRDTSVPMDAVADNTFDRVAPTSACGWLRRVAVRLALVSRSSQFERANPVTGANVTTAAPTWLGSATSPIVLTNAADWQNYRYRVAQTFIPLRNNAWASVDSIRTIDTEPGECVASAP